MHLTSPNLTAKHGFFTRKGGVSGGIYASLNCGWGSSDAQEHIVENRKRVATALGAQASQLLSLYQIHSADVVTVSQVWDRGALPKADAMVTREKNIVLGILTADCAPVLFEDAQAGVIAAAHAGWKGAVAGVLCATVEAMCALGANKACITAAIGPCIAQPSYEVSADFQQNLCAKDPVNAAFFIVSAKDQFYFDLKAYVRARLGEAGVTRINTLENDTYSEEDSFFSFRRTTHRSEPDYGRQVSAIVLT